MSKPRATFVSSLCQIYPHYEKFHVFTDWKQTPSNQYDLDPIMSIGLDSRGLLGAMQGVERHDEHVLDLCTGSGVQAIGAMHYYAKTATLVDINPRALRFARFNLVFNRLANRATVVHGSLYEPVLAAKRHGLRQVYDTILANPPFIPNPGKTTRLEVFGHGGDRGDDVTRGIIQGAASHLRDNGSIYIVATMADPQEYRTYLSSWWPTSAGRCSFLVLHGALWKPRDYAELIVSEPPQEINAYTESLKSAGISNIANGFAVVHRRPNWKHGGHKWTVHMPHEYIWQVMSGTFFDLVRPIQETSFEQ